MSEKKLFHVGSRDVFFGVSAHKGVIKVTIRHYAKTENGDLFPLSRGISMNVDEYQDMKKHIKKIDKLVTEVEKKKRDYKRKAVSPKTFTDSNDS